MVGNVSEFCWDIYGTGSTQPRFIMGGSSNYNAPSCRIGYARSDVADVASPHYGLRTVLCISSKQP